VWWPLPTRSSFPASTRVTGSGLRGALPYVGAWRTGRVSRLPVSPKTRLSRHACSPAERDGVFRAERGSSPLFSPAIGAAERGGVAAERRTLKVAPGVIDRLRASVLPRFRDQRIVGLGVVAVRTQPSREATAGRYLSSDGIAQSPRRARSWIPNASAFAGKTIATRCPSFVP
jgi:hypothetical protein